MEKLKKMTNFSFKREFSQPHKIPTVPSLSSENIEAGHTESLDIEDGLGPAFMALSSESKLSSSLQNSHKKSDLVQSEGRQFFKKLAVNLNITSSKGKDWNSKKKLFTASNFCQNDSHLEKEQDSSMTPSEENSSLSESFDYLSDELNITEDEAVKERPSSETETRNSSADTDIILNSLTNFTCYDIIQPNTKLVILDNTLTLKKALHSMMETGVRACPVWDNHKQAYVGMLTITDFIRILQKFYKGPDVPMKVFTEATLKDWQDIIHSREEFFKLSLEDRLIDACRILLENKIHRLPVVDQETGTIFSILNQKPILKFIYNILKQKSVRVSSLDVSIREAGVGSFDNIAVASKETKVIEILNKFLEEGVTALPIVDSEGKLTNIYSKFDVFSLESFFDLEITVEEATGHKIYFEGVYNCRGSDSVYEVLEKLVEADVNRLVIVNDMEKVEGVVTVSDLIDYVVLRHVQTKAAARHARRSDTPPPVWWSVSSP